MKALNLEKIELSQNDIDQWIKDTPKIETHAVTILMPFGVPELPALIIDKDNMHACFTLEELGEKVQVCESYEWPELVTIIDNNGWEYFYELNRGYLRPDWFTKRYKKKDILNLYNKLSNRSINNFTPKKKLAYILLRELITTICRLMVMN